MDKTFQIFIIFHKNIYDTCYKHISQQDLDTYFTFIAVNEKLPKKYTPNKYRVINEWEMPIYNPELQEKQFCENSALYHVFMNKLHESYDFVGFFQYDMPFLTNVIEDIKTGLSNNVKAFYGKNLDPIPNNYLMHTSYFDNFIWPAEAECFPILEKYEQYFNKKILKKSVYPYCNTYIIETKTFIKNMSWIIPIINEQKPHESLPGIYERIMGVIVGEENTFNNVGYLDIIHDRSINVFL